MPAQVHRRDCRSPVPPLSPPARRSCSARLREQAWPGASSVIHTAAALLNRHAGREEVQVPKAFETTQVELRPLGSVAAITPATDRFRFPARPSGLLLLSWARMITANSLPTGARAAVRGPRPRLSRPRAPLLVLDNCEHVVDATVSLGSTAPGHWPAGALILRDGSVNRALRPPRCHGSSPCVWASQRSRGHASPWRLLEGCAAAVPGQHRSLCLAGARQPHAQRQERRAARSPLLTVPSAGGGLSPPDEDQCDHLASRCWSPASMPGGRVADTVRISDLVGTGLSRTCHPDIALTVRRIRRTSS